MAAAEIRSEAFRQAALRSERLRIYGLIGAMGALVVVIIVRAFFAGTSTQFQLLPQSLGLVAGLIAYEGLMLAVISRMIRAECEPPDWTWAVNILIELVFPTVAMIVLTESSFMGPYRALVAPAILIFFFFIILSTLRLSPLLSILTGIFSAVGYLTVVAYTYRRYPTMPADGAAFSLPIYMTYAALFVFGGFLAGAVAHQIRSHVAAALREAETRRQVERMEHDLGIARSIQQGLLPSRSPEVDGFEVAGWSRPADQTGGDYYDWQALPDGRTVISVADVTGHGIGPALVTAVCRAYSRASFPAEEDIGENITRINQLLLEDLSGGRFVTLVVAVLDRADARVQLLSAGHGPLFLYTAADDRVRDMDAHGIPLGIAPRRGYGPAQEIVMAPGDMLILATDGFFEWANPAREFFGTERLKDVILAAKDLPVDDIIQRMYSAVLEFADGTSQQDDLTAVVLRRRPDGKAADPSVPE